MLEGKHERLEEKKTVSFALRLSDIPKGLQYFSEGGEGDTPPGDNPPGDTPPTGDTPPGDTMTKAEHEAKLQEELNRITGKIRKEERTKAVKAVQAEAGAAHQTEMETLMDEMRTIKTERDAEKKTAHELKMKDVAIEKLTAEGLSAGFANNVKGDTPEEIEANVKAFMAIMDGEIKSRVKGSIAGKTPQGSQGVGGQEVDPVKAAWDKEWA
ncbi:hypothetical protein [Bacillus sp. COPE52]|uniref:hypothetical protein n=1 Tax=Bacillus sp. COPE52 TaxID=2233998 RepID=UPI000E102B87|nr:hypothetical protein [Bacillus sp. COPE52]AXK19130.1 DUF4355 domain-containing protein [Bacillus sp. COPE52]